MQRTRPLLPRLRQKGKDEFAAQLWGEGFNLSIGALRRIGETRLAAPLVLTISGGEAPSSSHLSVPARRVLASAPVTSPPSRNLSLLTISHGRRPHGLLNGSFRRIRRPANSLTDHGDRT
jgi:hypothetical protein